MTFSEGIPDKREVISFAILIPALRRSILPVSSESGMTATEDVGLLSATPDSGLDTATMDGFDDFDSFTH